MGLLQVTRLTYDGEGESAQMRLPHQHIRIINGSFDWVLLAGWFGVVQPDKMRPRRRFILSG